MLVLEGLNKPIIKTKNLGTLKGIRMGRDLIITHLLFVVDILFFCNGTKRDAYKLKEIMDLYWLATKMIVNMGKYTISLLNIHRIICM